MILLKIAAFALGASLVISTMITAVRTSVIQRLISLDSGLYPGCESG